jgi:hypothetical protein
MEPILQILTLKKFLEFISPNRENVVKGMQTWVKVEEG